MSREQDNKAIVGRWFEGFWGNPWNPKIIDELAAPDMLLQYSLHAPRRGRDDVRDFIEGFRAAFPDLNFRSSPPDGADDIDSPLGGLADELEGPEPIAEEEEEESSSVASWFRGLIPR